MRKKERGGRVSQRRRRLSVKRRREVHAKTGERCAYCGCGLAYKDMQVDHVVPLNGLDEQGADELHNMLPSCRSCNHLKGRSPLENFRKVVANMPRALLRDSVTYKNARRFGLVEETGKPVVFYFEELEVRDALEGRR